MLEELPTPQTPEDATALLAHWPAPCQRCQAPLPVGQPRGEPRRRQVTELPPVRADVTEHRLHPVGRPTGGRPTRAERPADVPAGAFGPRLQATVAVWS